MKIIFVTFLCLSSFAFAKESSELRVGDTAPLFKAKTHEGKDFDLASRKGHWTILYFYPKADTPGCTKQACGFRDHIVQIRALRAEVYGVSSDDVKAQAAFHEKHKLNFTLIADEKAAVVSLYGSKMPVVNYSKRWTFIMDPSLTIRAIDKDVDPAMDWQKVAERVSELQKLK